MWSISKPTQYNPVNCSRNQKLVEVSYLLRARGCAFNRGTLKGPLFALFRSKAPVIHFYNKSSPIVQPSLSSLYESLWPADKMSNSWKQWRPLSASYSKDWLIQTLRDANSMTLTQRPPSSAMVCMCVCVCVIRLNGVALWVMLFNAGDLINGDWR